MFPHRSEQFNVESLGYSNISIFYFMTDAESLGYSNISIFYFMTDAEASSYSNISIFYFMTDAEASGYRFLLRRLRPCQSFGFLRY